MTRLPVFILLFLLVVSVGYAEAQQADFLTNYPDCDFATEEDAAGLQLGVVVLDFNTRFGCIQNLEMTFNAASVPKIFIAGAYYQGIADGSINISGTLQFTRAYWMGGSNDCLREDDIGTNYTYTKLVEFMINCSDNAATWMLMDSIGWGRVNAYVTSLGIDGIGEVIPYSEVDR